MSAWTPEQWVTFFGAAGVLAASVAAALVKILEAIRSVTRSIEQQTDQIKEHDVRQEIRADRLQNTILSSTAGSDAATKGEDC